MDLQSDVLGERQEPAPEALEDPERVIYVGLLRTRCGKLDVGVCDTPLDQLFQAIRIAQIQNANAPTSVLILVCRADSPAGCPDLLAGRALGIDELVIRKHEVRAIAHIETPLDVDPVRDQLVDLREQSLDVEHHTIADRAAHAGMQYAARNLMQHEGL